jgi:DNA-binding response OmpR family regulator
VLIEKHLTWSGFKVEARPNGAEAWETLRSAPFDLLITDDLMPRLNGIQLTAQARRAGTVLPIILEAARAARAASVAQHHLDIHLLAKPFTVENLLIAVDDALDEARPRA